MVVQYEFEQENIIDELVARGYVDNMTDEAGLKDYLSQPGRRFYLGFDATADSLTIGHFIQIMVMMRMQAHGMIPIALLGGGTTMIGDPSGRSDMRSMMTPAQIQHNADCFAAQMRRFIDFDQGRAQIVNNKDWLLDLNYLNFMREVGVHFNVGEMIKKDAYKNRMATGGLTFFEFSYMLLQSYDFLKLYQEQGCRLELGGSDQWANIIGGVELIRKAEDVQAFGLTFQLLTTADGVKMGKSMKGAVWLDEQKTSPYELFQYMRNVDDRDVTKFLLQLTFLPTAKCKELGSRQDASINEAKEILAYEITKLVHGEVRAQEALEASRALFQSGEDHAHMPIFECPMDGESIGLLDLMTQAGLSKSNGEARRLIQQGGVTLDDEKVTDPQMTLTRARLQSGLTLRKGKKIYLKIITK